MRFRLLTFFLSVTLLCSAMAEPSNESEAARTLILVNSRDPESVSLGEFYATQRQIPLANLVALPMPSDETITWRTFVDQIWQPLQEELVERHWIEGMLGEQTDELGRRHAVFLSHKIAYLVTCRGVPLRIHEDPTLASNPPTAPTQPKQFQVNQGAVDSELAMIALGPYPITGFQPNPHFKIKEPADLGSQLLVRICRLDGPSDAAARQLVTSALTAEKQGLIGRSYVDYGANIADGDAWFREVQKQIEQLGFDGDVETSGATLGEADRCDLPALYFGWYAGQANGPFLRTGVRFLPGAIAFHLHSFSASSLRTTTAGWCGPLIARGATATFGNVFEPYLGLTIRHNLLLESLVSGATLGEAVAYATPSLSWQTVAIGDPLYRPFKVSLEEQIKNLNQLPSWLGCQVIIRYAEVLRQQGQTSAARHWLARGQELYFDLAYALACAAFELRDGKPAAATAQLSFAAGLDYSRPEDWVLGRAAARFVFEHDSPKAALPIFRALIKQNGPSQTSRLQLLTEAKNAAQKANDALLEYDCTRLIAMLTQPVDTSGSGGK